jgi:2-iminobutanoate/2-iminopropanoate deaminase
MSHSEAIIPAGVAPVAGAPYTPGVRAGNTLYMSGQLGLDPATKQPYAEFERQVEGCIAGLRGLVEAAGGTLEDIVKTTVLMLDLGDFAAMNAVYARHFIGDVRPARSTFQVAGLPLGAAVEIEAIAVISDR